MDSELIRKIRHGDKQEFEALFRSSYSSLVRYAQTILKDTDTSEEIVQDLFFRIWQERENLRIESSFKGYLFRSVHNRCLHYIEHRKVADKYAGEYLATMTDTTEPVTEEIYYNELQEKVAIVLNRLPERCSKIFRMSRFEGMKYNEIAAKLSVSMKTVESNMGKALREFRKVLAE